MDTSSHSEALVVSEEETALRLDKLLTRHYPTFSRSYFQSLIEKGHVLINGEPCKKREKPSSGDEVDICFELPLEISLEPENIPLEILYEDEYFLAVNKPANMVVHPAPGHYRHTFVHALLYHCKTLERDAAHPLRPGIVHRLDKDTSGLLLAAKTSEAHRKLVELFSERNIEKTYLAVCLGIPKDGLITAPLKRHPIRRQEITVCREGGKEAISRVKVLAQGQKLSLVEVELITGRTHQIRVHLKSVNAPVLGDPVYGIPSANEKYGVTRQLLHASSIKFLHPFTHQSLHLRAPPPEDIDFFIRQFPAARTS